MTVPGNIGGLAPDGPDWLVRAVRELQHDVAMLSTAQTVQSMQASAVYPAVVNTDAYFDAATATGTMTRVSATVNSPGDYSRALVLMMVQLRATRDGTTNNSAQLTVACGAGRIEDEANLVSNGSVTETFATPNGVGEVTTVYAVEIDNVQSGVFLFGMGAAGTGWVNGTTQTNEANERISASILFMR